MKRLLTPLLCSALVITMAMGGCTTQKTEARPAPQQNEQPARRAGWPTMSGGNFAWSSLAYPTGEASTSAVGIEKGVPREVRLNAPFDYHIVVTNLTNMTLKDVAITEQIGDNMKVNSSSPEGRAGAGNTYGWVIGSLGPNESKTIKVNASATKEGSVGSCASVTYNSLLCASIPVVQPQLVLTKTGPAEVLRCETIEYRFTVKNSGTGSIGNVVINDPLPNGLTTQDGKNTVTFDAGTLAAGQSRDFSVRVKASQRGEYTNQASAAGEGGVNAQSGTVRTVVREPVLKITKTGPAREFIGRHATYDITVTNSGDGEARNTVVEDIVPSDATFVSATDGGAFANGRVRWNVGTLAPNASKKVSVTLTRATTGTIRNTATASAFCAEAVNATASTEYAGIPAVLLEVVDLEDPDQVGTNETYVITVTNQGSAVGTNIRVTCTLEANQEFVSASGATNATAQGATITMAPLASLDAGAKATWRVVVKNVKAGDVRFSVSMMTDQLTRPVQETEATNVYE